MNIQDYLIDPGNKDWQKLLGYWKSKLPSDAALWFVNRVGEVFFSRSDGSVSRLIVGTGEIEFLAANRPEFARLLDIPGNTEEWLRIGLVDGCRRAGMQLAADECLGFKIPPALLGKYEVSNLQPTNIYSHYSWLAHLTRPDEIYWVGD
jgi:hypothetical protein